MENLPLLMEAVLVVDLLDDDVDIEPIDDSLSLFNIRIDQHSKNVCFLILFLKINSILLNHWWILPTEFRFK